MSRRFGTLAALSILVAACGTSTPDDVIGDLVQEMNQVSRILEGVTDAESAKAVVPELEMCAARLERIQGESEKLAEDREAKRRAFDAHGQALEASGRRFRAALADAFRDPAVAAELTEILTTIRDRLR